MKRLRLLFFALMLIFNFYALESAHSSASLTNGQVSLITDADANGYINRGDTIRVRCNAVLLDPSTDWAIAPSVDFGTLGVPGQLLNDQGGGTFQADVTLTSWNNAINYDPVTITIYCASNVDFIYYSADATVNVDLCQVAGTGASALPATANIGDSLTIQITDSNYQSLPDQTIATVNLEPIGGNATTPLTYQGGNLFSVVTSPIANGINYTGPLTITLNDPMIGHPAVGYQTANITVDTQGPQVDFANTSVTINSGNAVAIPGDVLRITAGVTAYDNETVTVTCASLGNPPANPALNAGYVLPIATSDGVGNPATWEKDIYLDEANLKSDSLAINFSFVDDAGNVTNLIKYISIDLDQPNMVDTTLKVLLPDTGLPSTLSPLVGTSTCRLEIVSTITVDVGPDPLTVSIDLSAIGGQGNVSMTQVGLSDQYRTYYDIPQGAMEDGIPHTFVVTAKDAANNTVAQATTPEVRIDNNPPVISGAQLTADTAYIGVGNEFTIQCNVSGIENGSVTVDLSQIGLSNVENLPNVGGTTFRKTFTLPDSRDPGVPGEVEDNLSFTISANDTVFPGTVVGHVKSASTNYMRVDNVPPTILSSHSQYTHNLYPADDDGYARIGDSLSFHARVASDPVRVTINMSSLGYSNAENMIASAAPSDGQSGWYDYYLPMDLATGTFNKVANVPFVVTAEDNSDNATSTSILLNVDNYPTQANAFNVDITYKENTTDPDPGIINLNKSLHFHIPVTYTAADDPPTAQIDLSSIGGATDEAMTYGDASFSVSIDTAESSFDSTGHMFTAVITDTSGNRTLVKSTMYRVDCEPPAIVSASVEQTTGGAVGITGDSLTFKAEISNNESAVPTIDLTSIGGAADQAMTSTGSGKFEYTTTIDSGSLDEELASWTITAWDNDYNYATASTNELTIDNTGPDLATALNLTINGNPVTALSSIKIGDSLDFSLSINNAPGTEGDALVDLTAVGGNASATMTFDGVDTYTLNFTTVQASAEYSNYKFKATVYDKNANTVEALSSNVPTVDCQPVIFGQSGIVIWEDNGDNPLPGYANIGDTIMVYASATNYLDADIVATIGSDTVDFQVATLTYNASRNRHEATVTVESPGTNGWGTLTGSTDVLFYQLSGLDDVGNLTEPAEEVSTFTVRNVEPEIDFANTGIGLSTNRFLETAGDYPVFNLATDTVGDRLIASITFADGLPMHRAWLDFSEFGSGTVELTVSGDTAETPSAGIAANKLPATDYVQKKVYLHAMDQNGNISTASQAFWFDNIAPTMSSASFDGQTIQVNVSETFENLVYENFELVGSSAETLNTPVYLNFTATAPTVVEDLTSFELQLTNDHTREVAQWASTPVYLKVTNVATSALTDLSGNELPPVNYYPVTITDSTWRESAQITNFTMTHTWPASITLDIYFNKNMDEDSYVASNGVLLVAPLSYDFTAVDYTVGYVFQPEDEFTLSGDHLKIVMSEEGRDWIARKLGNVTANKLYFATRSTAHVFVYDELGKPMTHIPTSNPIQATDNRPTPGFDFRGPPNAPFLNLVDKTLVLSATDRMLLSNSDFDVIDSDIPDMGMPQLTENNRVTSFENKIYLHDIDKGTNIILDLEELDITKNNLFASTTVTLDLTENDFIDILNFFKANSSPIMRMTIGAGAFNNIWGTPNTAYLPSGNPGAIKLATPTGYLAATFAACAMNDLPPVNHKSAGELLFEIEVFPPESDGVIIPLQPQIEPTARLVKVSDSSLISSGTFVSYSERTVSGDLRAVYRFSNTVDLPTDLQSVPAQIEIEGITDIFGNTYSVTANYAYDLNTKDDSAADGYTNSASATIVIDTDKPEVTSIIPDDVIGKIPAGSTFKVIFDENMNESATPPTLELATSTSLMTFSFVRWADATTAEFTNDAAFTSSLPNGIWYYEVTGGQDVAGNAHDGTISTAFPVQVRTYAPEVSAGNVTLRTVQTTISDDVLIDQPWASIVGDGYFSIKYDTVPSQFTPHYLEIFEPSSNTRLGRAEIAIDSNTGMATATFADTDFYAPPIYPGLIGPVTFSTRIVDTAMNQTDTLSELTYDNFSPDVSSFNLTAIGSTTSDAWYYRPATAGNFTAEVVTTSSTDTLRLAIYSETDNATTTIHLNTGITPGNYELATGSNMADGNYFLSIVDLAGNIGSGPSQKRLIVDSVKPEVSSILPNDAIGNSPAGLTQFTVAFTEPMDGSPDYYPTLELATTSYATPIAATFSHWLDSATAVFENVDEITTSFPKGLYEYHLSGGRDLAGNSLDSITDDTHTVMVYSEGPFARIDNLTDQSHVYGNADAIKTNYAFNGNGSATLLIDYVAGPFNTPQHLEVYDESDVLVASSGVITTASATIIFPDELYEVGTAIPFTPADNLYSFKLVDDNDNRSGDPLPTSLRYDTASPTINGFTISSSGIATDTGSGLAYHYSPLTGPASFSITTSLGEQVRLLIINPTATYSTDLSGTGTAHEASYGSALPDSTYAVTVVDMAGNYDDTNFAALIVDSASPTVTAAAPTLAGGISAGAGFFDITFDEEMNTGISPTVTLATDSAIVELGSAVWLDSFTCRLSNNQDLATYPTGLYSYQISGAKDLAGNQNAEPDMGSFTIELFTNPPAFSASLITHQEMITGSTDLVNYPFSHTAAPGVATLSFTYDSGHPYQTPHTLYIYKNDNSLAYSGQILPAGTTTVAITWAMLDSPAVPATFTFRLEDSIGNISATSTTIIDFDNAPPDISSATITNVSQASSAPLYYNEALHGDLGVKFSSTATDELRLVLANGLATPTFAMARNDSDGSYSGTVPVASASAMATGTYVITAADKAGNFATGAAATTILIIDREAPVVDSILPMGSVPLCSSPAGGATFTVTFNESLDANATPTLSIATATYEVKCNFDSWVDAPLNTQARFVTASEITPSMPQGDYFYAVTATDLTGNVLTTTNATDAIQIRSRGPIVKSVYSSSFQITTASSSSEILKDVPFSFDVASGVATLSFELLYTPDSTPLELHFMQNNVTVASYTLVDGTDFDTGTNMGTFTWSWSADESNGPTPTTRTTYQVKLVDGSGDFSLESYNWTIDPEIPVTQSLPTVTGGQLATDSVYFNPDLHSLLNITFSAIEPEAPLARIRGENSTDTYALTQSEENSNNWSGTFNGRYSRGETPKERMPDGIYSLDFVDRAGNVGQLTSGDPIAYDIIIDTVKPGISTYSAYLNGLQAQYYAPSAGLLKVVVDSPELLNATGVYWLEVLNSSKTKVNKLPLRIDSGDYIAEWDGTNFNGAKVLNGKYFFVAADYAGNQASASLEIYAMTTDLQVTGSSQLSSGSARIWFNQEISEASLGTAVITASPSLVISNLVKTEARAVDFSVSPGFTHETSYDFTIATGPGTITNIYGAPVSGENNNNMASLKADAQGPTIVDVNFDDLAGMSDFKVVFDEAYLAESAKNKANYILSGPSGNIEIIGASTLSDQKTVLLTAASPIEEKVSYLIEAKEIQDSLGNISPASNTYSFEGLDRTPPVLTVSAFSNPANENDIIVLVTADEPLNGSPELYVTQNNASAFKTLMQSHPNQKTYMVGIHLIESYPGNGTLVAYAQDLAGNEGSGNNTFAVAYLSANQVASIQSPDKIIRAEFAKDSLNSDAMVKIMNHSLEKADKETGEIRTALQQQARLALGIRASNLDSEIAANHSELVPVTDAYEISVAANKVNKGFNVFMEVPAATETTGLGLFYQSGESWKFISSSLTRSNKLAAKAASSQIFAIMRDIKAPETSMAKDLDLEKPFNTARPEFRGQITEMGSGLDHDKITAHVDSGPAQPVMVNSDGNFVFKPMTDLTGGRHDLVIKASDRTGNVSQTNPVRFQVVVPLSISQIVQYPNPARTRAFIRISANRADINEDLVRVRIYDVSGHKVTTLDGIKAVKETWGINSRYLYDIPWDLRNSAGKTVANGVYFARIEIRDPDNPAKKVKETFKIAVLR